MKDRDLVLLINLLALSRQEISAVVRPSTQRYKYFDRDSEDEGTELPEIAFLLLCKEIFRGQDHDDPQVEDQIHEMSCICRYAVNLYDAGCYVFLLQTENSYDLFWDILARYARNILPQLEVIEDVTSEFQFMKMFEQYGFSAEKI